MALIVDDILMLPGTIGKMIFNVIAQTVNKVAWTEYNRNLRKTLLTARHDLEIGKIDRKQFKVVEGYVFKEMRVARRVLSGKK